MVGQYKKHVLSSGKEIHVYDGLLTLQLRDSVYAFLRNSRYLIGWKDGSHELPLRHSYLYSPFSEEDGSRAGLWPFLQTTPVFEHVKGLTMTKSIVNLSVPSDTHFPHAHPEKKVVLYYANLSWEPHWHGETLFFSEDLKEIELALPYTPGRIVVFDASIPHSIRPQSPSADHYRFTYAMTFN